MGNDAVATGRDPPDSGNEDVAPPILRRCVTATERDLSCTLSCARVKNGGTLFQPWKDIKFSDRKPRGNMA